MAASGGAPAAGKLAITEQQWLFYQNKLRGFLPRPRYEHSLRVAAEAAKMARHYGLDEERARLAGLLHDVARDLSFSTLFVMAVRLEVPVRREEEANPIILHAPVGAALLKRYWGITDAAVLKAVSLHTLAAPYMDDFCQLVYLADIIEPGRKEWPGLTALRQAGYGHLGQAMLLALQEGFNYMQRSNTFIHPQSLAAYDDFLTLHFMEQESTKK